MALRGGLDADEAPGLAVDAILRLPWLPDLIAGMARRTGAAFTGLGVERGIEARHRLVVLGTPVPVLTVSAAALREGAPAPARSGSHPALGPAKGRARTGPAPML